MACLDSSFIIDLLHGVEKTKEIKEELEETDEILTIASPAIVELISGAARKKHSDKQDVERLMKEMNVLPLDKESAILAGEIEAQLIKNGEIIDIEDVMIGAIARNNDETLITRNKKHFEKIPGLSIRTY